MPRRDITDLQICQAALQWELEGGKSTIERLEALHPTQPIKVIYAALRRAELRELLTVGVAWTTAKGKALVAAGTQSTSQT